MLFFALQLLGLLVFFITIAALLKPGFLRGAFAMLGAIAFAFELMSVAIGGSLIDYKFYAHFKLDVATNVGGFFENQVGLPGFTATF